MAYETEIAALNAKEAELLALRNQWETTHARLVQKAQDAQASAELAASYVQGGGGGPVDPDPEPEPAATTAYPNGTFSPTAYQAIAMKMGTTEAVSYVHGKKASEYGASVTPIPTLYKNVDKSLDEISYNYGNNNQIDYTRACILGFCGTWQIGGPPLPGQAGAYSSNVIQAMFVPDNPNALGDQGGIGVADMISFNCGENVASIRPELPWYYNGQGLDSINQLYYKSLGKNVSKPACTARGEGRPGWGISTLVAYRDGFIGTSGQNTGNNKAFVQLAAGKVPVTMCVTNAHEFAFVGVWDTVNNKGQIAVIALAGVVEGVDIYSDPSTWQEWRKEWKGVFPGLPSYGNIGYMKILGYIDLPPEIKCPTSMTASYFWAWQNYSPFEGNFDMKQASTRVRFRSGGDREFAMPKSGVMAVASREEKKVAFYDLRPLIAYYLQQYLTEPGIGQFGDGAGQWPPTFAEVASQMPTLIKVVDFANPVSCIKMSRYADNKRCYIGTEDGQLHIWDMGNYPAMSGGNPASIQEIGSVTVGRNPTHIGLIKQHAGDETSSTYFGTKIYPNADFSREIIVTSRGDRKIDWVRMNSGYSGGSIIRTLQDTRLIDPIMTEDNDNHTTEHYEVTAIDHAGKQVISYRYGPLIFWWNEGTMSDDPDHPMSFDWTAGLPPNGIPVTTTTFNGTTHNFECAGQFTLPGHPFSLTMANVY